MSEWQETELGLACDRVTGRLNSNAAVPNGKYPFFTCSPETLAIDNFAFDTEALLLAENNANGIFPLKYYKGKFNAYQRTYVITPKNPTEFDIKFLYYQLNLRLNYFKEISQGTATKFLTAGILDNLPISYSEIDEQNLIAKILSSLDEKIELNRKQNRTLEAIAQALFKRWFVEFEFPDQNGRPYKSSGGAMQPSELGEIAVGWEVAQLGDFVVNKKEPANPSLMTADTAYVGLEHIGRRALGLSEWGAANNVTSNKSQFSTKDVLFGKLRPYFHKVAIAPFDGICSTDILVLQAKDPRHYCFMVLLIFSDAFVTYSNNPSTGTRTPRANWMHMKEYSMAFPQKNMLAAFNEIFLPGLDKIRANIAENRLLANLRDTLLPKLMSGELRVPPEQRITSHQPGVAHDQ